MNINLSSSNKKQKKSLGFGLNQRSSSGSTTKKKKKGGNVLLDEDDDSEEEIDETAPSTNHRDAVNREIAAEQAALRKRADLALRQADRQVYDYDGAYESMQQQAKEQLHKATAAAAQDSDSKKSRYIQDLLKQSEKRALEREAIHERKVAREQAEEDAQADYQGKEKFVTKAYKRKLEERQRMAEEDKKQQQRDEREDVTKKTGGAAFANFYGNIHRNVAMGAGGTGDSNNISEGDKGDAKENTKATTTNTELPSKLGFMDGFERAGDEDAAETKEDPTQQNKDKESSKVELPVDPEAKNRLMRKAREEKLAQARIRYFQRKGMMPVGSTA